MKTATVKTEGDHQAVHLPKDFHLPTPTVSVRYDGESVVLEPLKSDSWPKDFFASIHISDPTFVRPAQGQIPPIKGLQESE